MNSDLLDAALKKNQEKRTAMNLPFVVQIITKLKDYSHFGSGCLLSIVDEIVILTCAHNFCSVDKGVNAKPTFMVEKDTHFYLGNGENRRFFNIKKFEIYPKYLNQPEIYDGYDLAVGIIDQTKLTAEDKKLALQWSNSFEKGEIQVAGYPEKYSSYIKDFQYKAEQFGMSGEACLHTNPTTVCQLIKYNTEKITTSEGQSGSPVIDLKNPKFVCGVHVGFDQSLKQNVATKLNEQFLLWVLKEVLKKNEEFVQKNFPIKVPFPKELTQKEVNRNNLSKIAAYAITGGKKYDVNMLEFCPFQNDLLKKAASSLGQDKWMEISKTLQIAKENEKTRPFVYMFLAVPMILNSMVNRFKTPESKDILKIKSFLELQYLTKYSPTTPKPNFDLNNLRVEVVNLLDEKLSLQSRLEASYLFYTIERMILQESFFAMVEQIFNEKSNKYLDLRTARLELELILKKSKIYHEKIKKKMCELVCTVFSISNSGIRLKTMKGDYLELYDWSGSFESQSFAMAITNEFYRCNITNATVDALYEIEAWDNFWNNRFLMDFSINAAPLIHVKEVGLKIGGKVKKMDNPSSFLWKFGLKDDQGMAYSMDFDGTGFHTHNYQDPAEKTLINFRSTPYIFIALRNGAPALVTLANDLKENYFSLTPDLDIKKICSTQNEFSWVLELQPDELVTDLYYFRFNYLNLQCNQFAENFKQCHGYIKNPSSPTNFVSYGLSWVAYYYNFHPYNPDEDERSSLIFNCAVFQNPKSLKEKAKLEEKKLPFESMTCKISTKSDPLMFMARNDRDTSSSYMGNNRSGGELVVITPIEYLSENVYKAKIRVRQFNLFIAEGGHLMWINGKPPGSDIFQICIREDKY